MNNHLSLPPGYRPNEVCNQLLWKTMPDRISNKSWIVRKVLGT